MATTPTEQQLAGLETLIARDPDAVEPRYLRAGLLAALGRNAEAQQDYIEVITREPTHFGALNDLGTLLFNTDYRSAARTAYAEAVTHHPDNPMGRINLANALLADGQADEALIHYGEALRLAPDHPDAHQGLANLLQDRGEHETAERHRQQSYRSRELTTLPYRGAGPPCQVLLLVSAVGGNVPTRFLLDDTLFAVTVLAVEAFSADRQLPPHELIFNAVGDADLGPDAVQAAAAIAARSAAPVINAPARVLRTGRETNARDLGDVAGVRAPQVMSARRADLASAAGEIGYPLLVRSLGFHTGRYFQKVDRPSDLASATEPLPGEALLLIEFLDARDGSGRARKFRVMIIDGALYPLHLAISSDWKVHYFTADMLENPAHRAEEAAFLTDMEGVLGVKAIEALRAIAGRLGLDYAGVDFGLGTDGELLLFEANATMVVNPPDADPRWDYRRAPVDRILAAARAMLLARAGR